MSSRASLTDLQRDVSSLRLKSLQRDLNPVRAGRQRCGDTAARRVCDEHSFDACRGVADDDRCAGNSGALGVENGTFKRGSGLCHRGRCRKDDCYEDEEAQNEVSLHLPSSARENIACPVMQE